MAAALGVSALGLCLSAVGETLTVVADTYPPYLNASGERLTGPYADAFRRLMAARGIQVVYQYMPARRALQQAISQPNTCAMAVNFDQGASEQLNYVAVLAPITLTAFSRGDEPRPPASLQDLHSRRVGAVNIAEVRDVLGSNGIAFFPVEKSDLGFLMLAARRFDVLISDRAPPQKSGARQGERALVLTRIDRWLACNATIAPATLRNMRMQLREGLFDRRLESVWASYQLRDFYLSTRAQWLSGSVRP